MEQLFSRLSFEVRESVHHITGLLELLSEEPLSRSQSRYLARSKEIADRLLHTSEDLSILTNPESVPLSTSVIPLAETVAEVAELMHALAVRKHIAVSSSVDQAAPRWIVADKDLIQDSLRRVLDNAIRYTPEGSVSLSVHVTRRAGEDVRLEFQVRDTGPGIPDDVQKALSCADALPSTPGIGLRVVQKRLVSAGGSIAIERNDPHGAVVQMSLPVTIVRVDPDTSADPPGASPSAAQGEGAFRLLIAEDSDDSFLLTRTYLKGGGYQIARAKDGVHAVQMATDGQYDLIMMDANMPGMDGYEATRIIREWETEGGRKRIPIVLVSADDRVRQRRLGAVVGCSAYVEKPTTKARVLAALHFFLAGQPSAGAPSH